MKLMTMTMRLMVMEDLCNATKGSKK